MEAPVKVKIIEKKIDNPPVKAVYPQVKGLKNKLVEVKINEYIRKLVYDFIKEVTSQTDLELQELVLTYSVKLNEKGLLSLVFERYIYTGGAHGITVRKSSTIDLTSGYVYKFSDLFKPGSDYIGRLSSIVKAQIEEKEVPLLEEFESIDKDQEFFLTPDALVLYYQLYRYTPYAYGFPEFEIPYSSIEDIINGPLEILLNK